MNALLNLDITGANYSYQRNQNFSIKGLEKRLLSFYDKAEHLILCSSGMEAVTSCVEYLFPDKATIVIDKNLYYETRLWFKLVKRYNVIEIDLHNLQELSDVILDADLVFLDNPNMFQEWFDLKKISDISHSVNVKVVVDNSIVSIGCYNPLKDGADIVVESYSKYMSGHRDLLAGGIVFAQKPENMARLEAFFGWRGRVVHPVMGLMLDTYLDTFLLRLRHQEETTHKLVERLKKLDITVLYSGMAACFILPLYKISDDRIPKIFQMLATYGTVNSIITPSHQDNLYKGFPYYLRVSVGLEDINLLWKDLCYCLKLQG